MVTNFEAKEAVDKLIRYCIDHVCKAASYLFHFEPHMSAKEKVHANDYIERMKNESQGLVEKWDKLNAFRCRHCTQLDDTENYLMSEQLKVMDEYIHILEARIAHAALKEKTQEEI